LNPKFKCQRLEMTNRLLIRSQIKINDSSSDSRNRFVGNIKCIFNYFIIILHSFCYLIGIDNNRNTKMLSQRDIGIYCRIPYIEGQSPESSYRSLNSSWIIILLRAIVILSPITAYITNRMTKSLITGKEFTVAQRVCVNITCIN